MKKYILYFGKYWYLYLLALVCLVIYEVLDMISPTVTRSIIDDVIMDGQVGLLTKLLLTLVVIGVGRVISGYVREFTFDKTSFKVASDIRKNLFGHIQGLSVEYFDKMNTGEIMSRVKDDVDKLQGAFGFIGMMFLQVVIHTVMIIWCMWRISPVLTIFPMIALPACATIAIVMERKLDKVYEEISDEDADMNTVAEENLSGVRVVKAFAREKFEIGKFLSHNKKYYDLNMKQSKVWIRYNPIMQMITKMLTIIALLLGGLKVINGDMSLGSLGAFLEYCSNAVWPMEMLGWLSNELAAAFASKKKLDKIYAETAVICDPKNVKEDRNDDMDPRTESNDENIKISKAEACINNAFSSLEFENVSFTRENKSILKNVSFRLENGKTLGIMGATGSGKTTIINMMLRFYDPDEGRVLLNGTDLKELPLETVRKNAAVVMQDVFLFSDTIEENIKLGRKDSLTDSDINEALESACASEFVDKLEDKTATIIGERGVGLSGGQKQRISMARAFAKHASVLVLDDSTSALDMETEHEVQKHLGEMEGLTKLIIAHRISAVRHADEIIVIENGGIAERGTHEELLAARGYYYKTYMAQYGEFLNELGDGAGA